jgi:SAM-dependent methyltransferase
MTALSKAITDGHFASKQLASKSRLISWSHQGRFDAGVYLAREFAGKRVLDYGSGDGSFLAMLINGDAAPARAVGAELQANVVEDCRSRLGSASLRFVLLDELNAAEHQSSYDAVICMEVLEHVLDPDSLLQKFACLLSPSGQLLLSVPVETGLPLLVKQSVRRVAGWRGIGDYPGTTGYSFGELARSVFAKGTRQHIRRPIHTNPDGSTFHDHKGFNWMVLQKQLQRGFEVERIVGSPLRWLTPHLASQVWFVARKK